MRLLEFRASKIMMRDLINTLSDYFDMERVGGDSRVYDVGGRLGVIFLINNSHKGVGLIWSKGSNRVETVAVWKKINFDAQPDYVVDLPDAYLVDIIDGLVKFIRNPHMGVYEDVTPRYRNVTPDEFRAFAKQMFGDRAKRLTLDDLQAVKDKFEVGIPSAIRHNPLFQTDAQHWNLLDDLDPAEAVARANGGKVGEPDSNDPNYQEMLHLAKVSKVKDMVSTGSVVIMGRKPNGEVFKIPGIEDVVAQLERLLHQQGSKTSNGGLSSMEEQYKALNTKVNLVVKNESEFIKSLLVTGMPSAGKTFNIMKTIKEAGLKSGEDYVTKKGKISAKSLYRVLIQQINGLAVFDDCDSVVKDPDGVNMLKGALDTEAVRTVDYDVQGLMNTDAMSFERRGEIVNAMSAILRGVPTEQEMAVIERLMGVAAKRKENKKGKKDDKDPFGSFIDSINSEGPDDGEITMERIREAEAFVMNNLPNKIDYYGRIIFISNMSEDEWKEVGDGAIINRAFHQNMNFPDNEMLDYIDSIKQHINTPRLTDEDKQRVIDYVRELWVAGKITKPINFRLIQQCFDLYLMNDWKSLIANIG